MLPRLLVLLLLSFACTVWAGPTPSSRPRFPDALAGVWYPLDTHDPQQCQIYLRDPQDDRVWPGQVAVRGGRLNEYAEYGEGTEHRLLRLQSAGPGVWVANTRIALDGGDEEGVDRLRLSLQAGQLVIEHVRPAPAQGWAPAVRYRRCSATVR